MPLSSQHYSIGWTFQRYKIDGLRLSDELRVLGLFLTLQLVNVTLLISIFERQGDKWQQYHVKFLYLFL